MSLISRSRARERHFTLVSLAALIVGAAPCAAWAQTTQGQAAPAPAQTAPTQAPAKDNSSTKVSGVTVTADQAPVRTSIDRRSYDITKDLQAANGAPIADALRNLPSVDVDLNGAVTLRGQSGVTIMVDGKPSTLYSGPGGAQALLQVPADQYERVEVMTNPSAAFSPDGSAGIINLISKKTHKMGSFGTINGRVGTAGREYGGASANLKTDKYTVSFYAGAGRNPFRQSEASDTHSFDALGAPLSSNLTRTTNHGDQMFGYGGGSVQWDPDSKTQIVGNLNGWGFSGRFNPDSRITVEDGAGVVQQVLENGGRSSFVGNSVTAGLSYRRDFAGDDHNLLVSLNRDQDVFTQDQLFSNTSLVPPAPATFQKNDNRNVAANTDFKGDYKRPMPGSAKFSAGWDVRQEDNLNDTSGFLTAPTPAGPDDASQLDHFHFQRLVSAAYATYQRPFGKLTVMGGLRVEQTHLDIDDRTSAIEKTADDAHLYPTLHLSYDLTDAQQFMLSYSERIQRPNAQAFDPFRREGSPFSFSQGNPNLKPEQTQDFEASYQYRAGGVFYLATAYYKLNTGGFTSITTSLGNGVYLDTQENLTRSRDAGLELVATGHFTKTLSYNLSGNLSWNQVDASALGFTTPHSGTTVSGRGSVTWQATPKDTFQLNGYISGRHVTPQGFTESSPNLNVGYQHKLTDKLTLVVTAQNVLGDKPYKQVFDTPTLRGESQFLNHNQTVYLGLRWAFGAGGKQRQPDFDFGDGAPGPGGPH